MRLLRWIFWGLMPALLLLATLWSAWLMLGALSQSQHMVDKIEADVMPMRQQRRRLQLWMVKLCCGALHSSSPTRLLPHRHQRRLGKFLSGPA